MNNNIDSYRFVQKLLNLVEKKNNNKIKCAEAYLSKDEYINVDIEENSIKYSKLGVEKGISIRVFDKRGACGFAFTNKFQNKFLENMVQNAIRLMKGATPDIDFKDLPKKYKQYPNINNLFDKNIKALEIEDASQFIEDIIEVCKNDESAISQSADFKTNCSEVIILNSNGINISRKETVCSFSSNIIAKDKDTKETSFGSDWLAVRNLDELNTKKVAQNALEKAKRNLNRKRVKKMNVPLILTPQGAISLILRPLSLAINAETFQYKRSFLVGHRGEKIGSKLMNIEDNGLIDGATGSSICDDEGIPNKNKKIIEKGKFLQHGLLHNSYTAAKEGIESTGNALRSSYSSPPGIGVNNFIFHSGNSSKNDIIKEISRGILLDYTGDSPNISTGDFSGLILQGNLIKNGEITHPLNETMVGINLFNLFKNISAVSKESKTYGKYSAPYIKINNVNVIGSAPDN
jgi:PmbA protein